MLPRRGTTEKSGEEIADFFDFHAGWIESIFFLFKEGLGFYSTKKHVFKVLPTFVLCLPQKATSQSKYSKNEVPAGKIEHQAFSNEKDFLTSQSIGCEKVFFGVAHALSDLKLSEEEVPLWFTGYLLSLPIIKKPLEDLRDFCHRDLKSLWS